MAKSINDFEERFSGIMNETSLKKERIVFNVSDHLIRKMWNNCFQKSQGKIGIIGYADDLDRIKHCINPDDNTCSYFPVSKAKLCRNPAGTYKIEMEDELKQIASLDLEAMMIVSLDISHILSMYLITYRAEFRIINFYDYMAAVYGLRLKAGIGGGDVLHYLKRKVKAALWYSSKASATLGQSKFIKQTFRRENAFDSYDAIYSREHLFKREKNPEVKKWYQREIIDNYLEIRDFRTAFEYMDQYIKAQCDGYEKVSARMERLEKMLDELKETLKERRKKDIIFFWIDSISEVERAVYGLYQRECEAGIHFEHAYTHVPVTRETMFAIMSGCSFFENRVYEWSDVADGKNYKYLREMGYDVKDIGAQFISKAAGVVPKREPHSFYYPTSLHAWVAMMELSKADLERPQCFFIHCDSESHNPYWGGQMSHMEIGPRDPFIPLDAYTDIIKNAEIYQENQIRWYAEFLSEQSCKVYFSDHGKGFPFWAENKVRTFLIINDNRFAAQKVDWLYSYLDFDKLFRFLINPEKYPLSMVRSEYALIQNDEPYEKMVVEVKKHSLDGEIGDEFNRKWMGFNGVVTEKLKVVNYRNGDQIILSLPEEKVIKKMNGQNLEEVCNLAGKTFSDMRGSEHYRLARELYESLEIPY